MDALVEELLRLENSKHTALILIDPAAYDATVQEQMQLLANTKETVRTVTNVARLLALSQLITLNTRLLHNLMATTPVFPSSETNTGRMAACSYRECRGECRSRRKNVVVGCNP
jgi:hypothetical protein